MRKCKVDNCNNKVCAKGYCSKHYMQYRKYGCILERTKFDSNEIIEYEDYAEIVLYDKDNMEVARAFIDLEDIDKVKDIKWCLNSKGYVYSRKLGLYLHRYLMNPSDDEVVDHINHCKYDNRRCNLRICSQQQNTMNKLKYRGRSQYKGVCWIKQSKKWHVKIRVNNKQKSIGSYDSEEEGAIAYDKAAILHFGGFASTNFPIENYIDYILELGLNPSDFGIDID